MIIIKKLSEVCKITGVSRRTLQGYDKIGLLKHSAETSGGYWLYDGEAIRKLILIQIFVEVGYKRKEIKKIIESSNEQIKKEYDLAIQRLHEKRKRIDGLIFYLDSLKISYDLPIEILNAISQYDLDDMFHNNSYKELFEKAIKTAPEIEVSDEVRNSLVIIFKMIGPGFLKQKSVNNSEVQDCVKAGFDAFIEFVIKSAESDISELIESEKAELYGDIVTEICNDEGIIACVNALFGKGAIDFILEATHIFTDNLINEFKKREENNG